MNKGDLIEAIAAGTSSSKADAERFVDQFVTVVQSALASGDSIRLVGFGTFDVVDVPARNGRNPKTGEAMKIAARKRPRFRPGSTLIDAAN